MKTAILSLVLLAVLASAAFAQPAARNGDFRTGTAALVTRATPGASSLPVDGWTLRQQHPGAAAVQLVRGFNPAFDPEDSAVWLNAAAHATALVQAFAPALREATATATVYVVSGRAALCLERAGADAACAYTTGDGRWEHLQVTAPTAGDDDGPYDAVVLHSAGAAQFFADDVRLLDESVQALPAQVALEQNYPNPFNPLTTIRYALPARTPVRVDVYDATGRLVRRLVDDVREGGAHEVRFDAGDLPSGVYFVRLAAGRTTQTRPVTLVR